MKRLILAGLLAMLASGAQAASSYLGTDNQDVTITSSAINIPVNLQNSIPAGTNNIGDVDVLMEIADQNGLDPDEFGVEILNGRYAALIDRTTASLGRKRPRGSAGSPVGERSEAGTFGAGRYGSSPDP